MRKQRATEGADYTYTDFWTLSPPNLAEIRYLE